MVLNINNTYLMESLLTLERKELKIVKPSSINSSNNMLRNRPTSTRPSSSRLRNKIDSTYSYFTNKVDPIISSCVTNFLLAQPKDIISALKLHFKKLKNIIINDNNTFDDILCYNPKKTQKIYFTYELGPILSKIIEKIAEFQPLDVVDYINEQLANNDFIRYISSSSNNFNEKNENEIKQNNIPLSSRRNKLNDAINLANTIGVPVLEANYLLKTHVIEIIENKEIVTTDNSEVQNNKVFKTMETATTNTTKTPTTTTPNNDNMKNIQISFLGMNNSGKTSIINALQGNFNMKMKPSLGFKPTTMMLGENINVKFYDLGGGAKIRDIWSLYYHDIHAIVYVFDASLKGDEMSNSIKLFNTTIINAYLHNKPLLILANKQDKLDVISCDDIWKRINIDSLDSNNITLADCSSFISKTSNIFNEIIKNENDANKDSNENGTIIIPQIPQDTTIDNRLEIALESFLIIIQKDFSNLDKRVNYDILQKKNDEIKKRLERERKVLRNKIAVAFQHMISPELLPENLPLPGPDDAFTKEEGECLCVCV